MRSRNCPCIGDYPHIGVDANGYYITTNEYPWFVAGFNGAQIYAMSKTALASGATAVRVEHFDTARSGPGGNPGFTVWPAQSPNISQYDATAGGTEYFMSTNAAEEANGTGSSSTVAVWSLTGTSVLNATAGAPLLRMAPVTVGEYAVPPPADQKVGPVPLADCLNLTACSKLVAGTPDKFKESERPLDSLDSRMQQVDYANGLLYGANGTALDVGSPPAQKAGIAWYIVDTTTAANGNLSATVSHQGRLATAGNNLVMPAMGVRNDGSAVIGMTLAGANHFPSAAYVDLTSAGVTSTIHVLAEGVGPEDGFAGYRLFGGRPRWGDYGATAVDGSGNMWVAFSRWWSRRRRRWCGRPRSRRRPCPRRPAPGRSRSSGRKVSTMTASSSVAALPMDASTDAGLRTVGEPRRVQRDRPLLDARTLARHEVAAGVEDHLVGVDVGVVVRRRDRHRGW